MSTVIDEDRMNTLYKYDLVENVMVEFGYHHPYGQEGAQVCNVTLHCFVARYPFSVCF